MTYIKIPLIFYHQPKKNYLLSQYSREIESVLRETEFIIYKY
ncbi:hypothetical protein ASZ90_003257 [hydrocarbon metagenome]|uniref:Uncharacterized protein n=1 Tax=hydrocarbon metagenome TaxID=938273 RepID=A0A0W8G162_9ZZZZ